ncbi:MAG TPA: SH3 domain-containing protein [Aggregatilineales bacterium]|nr:SH3 domain-containing protein [Anaerolineales bacterium]HRE49241.1 SH3 domain-containing protein [Aggregatilineales bacterium]
MKRLVLAGLLAALLIGTFALGGGRYPTQAQSPTRDRCRDELGNEICTHFLEIDGRVNPADALATIAGYCRAGGSVEVWGIYASVGQYLFTASQAQIVDALAKAQGLGTPITVNALNGRSLSALPSALLQLYGDGYAYTFSGELCGIPVPPPSKNTSGVVFPPQETPLPPKANVTPLPTLPATSFTYLRSLGGQPMLVLPPDFKLRTQNYVLLNYRSQPVISQETYLGQIPSGTVLRVLAREATGAWLFVLYEGEYVWVARAYTMIPDEIAASIPLLVVEEPN